MNRVLIEVAGPPHVHFFKVPIRLLLDKGWECIIYAHNKIETFSLLRAEGLEFYEGPKIKNTFEKFKLLLPQTSDVYHLAKKYRVKVMAGIVANHAALASRISRIPFISFIDTAHIAAKAFLYSLNCTRIYTPRPFKRNFGKKQVRYPGYHEISYLHPKYFTPSNEVLKEYGLLDRGKPIVVRVIKWDAIHDIGVKRLEWERKFIKRFAKDYAIVVSAEGEIPRYFREFSNPLPPHEYHNLLAHSSLYVGPGATSASECAMLGVPAIYTNPLKLGYIDELEKRYSLVFQERDPVGIIRCASDILDIEDNVFQTRRKRMLKEICDVAQLVVEAIEREAGE